jgi:hypothetical protein
MASPSRWVIRRDSDHRWFMVSFANYEAGGGFWIDIAIDGSHYANAGPFESHVDRLASYGAVLDALCGSGYDQLLLN